MTARSLPEPTLSANAIKVLERRYLKKDAEGRVVETPTEMFERVAHNLALADKEYDSQADIERITEEFYSLMANLEFLPNSPTLMNAGRELQQLAACFVLPIEDSMDSIFTAVKNTALIHKSGGGTGFSFSRLRPKNDVVQSTKGISSGPVSFMGVFDAATEAIKQGGTRRGANMAILRVDHPDILDFIRAKEESDRLNNFNISVGLTEEFMQAVKEDKEYDLVNPHNHEPIDQLRARDVFGLIVEMAWRNGEPGIVFLDRINRDNPTPALGDIESTNPCGEQPLLPYESCNLGSINLSRMATERAGKITVDYQKLARTARAAVHLLDNVIDMSAYPLDEIAELTRGNRKIGLGVMGFADLLISLGIPYDSEEAVTLGGKLMGFIAEEARQMSVELARARGPFPNFDKSVYCRPGSHPIRNATITTVAPTGTLSIIADCSSGIEPLFALCFYRRVMDDDRLIEVNRQLEQVARERGFLSQELLDQVASRGGVRGLREVPEDVQRVFATAHDVSPYWHVRMQASFQEHTDNAVSKTVNFPNSAAPEDVYEVYELANQLGCKGVTIYRDGSRDAQVLNIEGTRDNRARKGEGELNPDSESASPPTDSGTHVSGGTEALARREESLNPDQETPRATSPGAGLAGPAPDDPPPPTVDRLKGLTEETFPREGRRSAGATLAPRERPELTFGGTIKVRTSCGNLYITVNEDEEGLCEVFSRLGKSGGCIASHTEAISRLISLALRSRIGVESIVDQIRGIRCPSPLWDNGGMTLSCADGIAHALEAYIKSARQPALVEARVAPAMSVADLCPQCPDCGGMVEYVEGCVLCRACGYSKCG